MIVQNIITGSCTPQTIVIGRRGTYDTLQIAFDLSYLIESYGSGTAVLAVKRSQDTSAYPAVVTQEDNILTWTVSETDTAYVGSGECQLMWYVDGGLAKTIIYPMVVMRDIIQTAEEPPDGYENWLEHLTELGAETQQNAQNAAQSVSDASTAKDDAVTAKEAAEAAQKAAETAVTHYPVIINGYWNIWSVEAQSYVSTGIQAEGEDGYSPEVTITSIACGHRVTITDKDHPQGQSFDVLDGQGGGGNVNDVLVNNTSVLVNGIANVPAASANTYGVVKTGEFYGTKIVSGKLTINTASPGDIKEGETNYRPIAPLFADYAAFYGLARAAGDTSQALSLNTVGNYTDNAKTAIKNMLGVDAGGIAYDSTETYQAGTVGAELSNQSRQLSDLDDEKQDKTAYVTLSGTVVTQVGADNTMYLCGELAELTFTAPATGITVIRFTSGSTPTVITLNGITMPDDWTGACESNKRYDICVLNGDGLYCARTVT